MAYLAFLNSYTDGSTSLRTPVLSAFISADTDNVAIPTGQQVPVQGPWSLKNALSALPSDVASGSLFDPSSKNITFPYDGVYSITFNMRVTFKGDQVGFFNVVKGTMKNIQTRLAFTSCMGDSLGASYTGFFYQGHQVQSYVYTTCV